MRTRFLFKYNEMVTHRCYESINKRNQHAATCKATVYLENYFSYNKFEVLRTPGTLFCKNPRKWWCLRTPWTLFHTNTVK